MIYDNSDRGLYQSAYDSGYAKGRADAIEDFKNLIRSNKRYFLTDGIAELFIDAELEELKEQV